MGQKYAHQATNTILLMSCLKSVYGVSLLHSHDRDSSSNNNYSYCCPFAYYMPYCMLEALMRFLLLTTSIRSRTWPISQGTAVILINHHNTLKMGDICFPGSPPAQPSQTIVSRLSPPPPQHVHGSPHIACCALPFHPQGRCLHALICRAHLFQPVCPSPYHEFCPSARGSGDHLL